MSSAAKNKEGFICELCNIPISTTDEMRTHLLLCASKTEQCEVCKKYVTRYIFAYHTAHNCSDPPDLFNEDTNTTNNISLTALHEKTEAIKEKLKETYYETEIDHVTEKLRFGIILIGSPRVGKSQLINALCDGQQLAKTSNSLNSCTQKVTEYTLKSGSNDLPGEKRFEIKLFDTPGIESWNNNEGVTTMIKFIEENNALCVIYCASPGSFARIEQLNEVLKYCKEKDIFCALVCTNMWAGNARSAVMKDFEENLTVFGEKVEKFSDQSHTSMKHKVTFFGKGALCTMVNSTEYYDPEFSEERKPVQGIDELIHGIMESLECEKLLGWCYVVLNRRSYWEKLSQKMTGFFAFHQKGFNQYQRVSPLESALNFFSHIYDSYFNKKK